MENSRAKGWIMHLAEVWTAVVLMSISEIFICDGKMRCEMDKNSWEDLMCSVGKTCEIWLACIRAPGEKSRWKGIVIGDGWDGGIEHNDEKSG